MTVVGPSEYIDKKTGELRRLQSFRDYLLTEALPTAAHAGLHVVKGAVLYAALGPLGLVAPAATYLIARQSILTGATRSHDMRYNDPYKADDYALRFDLTKEQDRQEFTRRYGSQQPRMMIDILHMTKTLGMKELPMIEIMDPVHFDIGKGERELRNLHGGLAVTSRPDGKKPVLIVGAGAMQTIAPDEMRGILAHEMTHAKLKHLRQKYLNAARKPANRIFNLLLVGAAVFGGLPLLPTLGLIAVSQVAHTTIDNIRSRRREHLCDQGAALITGHTRDFISGMRKISKALSHINSYITKRELAKKGVHVTTLREPGTVAKFILASHPDDAPRLQRAADFGKKYPDFCAAQRSKFAQTFNAVAAHEKKKPPQPVRAPQRRL